MTNDFYATKIRIVEAMLKAGKPLILQHIAENAKMTPQLVKYHLVQMVDEGIAGTTIHEEDGNVYYLLQPPYYDKNWQDALYNQLTPFVLEMGKTLDDGQAKVPKTKVVVRNLAMFLRLFESKIEKTDFEKT